MTTLRGRSRSEGTVTSSRGPPNRRSSTLTDGAPSNGSRWRTGIRGANVSPTVAAQAASSGTARDQLPALIAAIPAIRKKPATVRPAGNRADIFRRQYCGNLGFEQRCHLRGGVLL